MDGLLYAIIVGAVAGWLAGLIVRGFGFGLLGNIIVGIVGGWLGSWLLGGSIKTGNATLSYILTALIGAVVLLFVISLLSGRRRAV